MGHVMAWSGWKGESVSRKEPPSFSQIFVPQTFVPQAIVPQAFAPLRSLRELFVSYFLRSKVSAASIASSTITPLSQENVPSYGRHSEITGLLTI